ncbi:MAG TPA: hypothetical protein ENH59_10515 [Bacteroidetes bacterium]|nr:hypothetical protein [Bacteroidota bacterium]
MITKIKNSVYRYRAPVKDPNKVNLHKILADEDCEDFYTYIDWLDLSKSPNIIVLPLSNHYYYHPEDFAKTDTLINLKCLNQINDLASFLGKIYSNLPSDCFFIGCFINGINENSNLKGNNSPRNMLNLKFDVAIWKGMLKKIFKVFNLKNAIKLRKENVRSILNELGFLVLDMTELNGKTYFCAKKQPLI